MKRTPLRQKTPLKSYSTLKQKTPLKAKTGLKAKSTFKPKIKELTEDERNERYQKELKKIQEKQAKKIQEMKDAPVEEKPINKTKKQKTKTKQSKRMQDIEHLVFIKQLPCLVCGYHHIVDAHHLLRTPERGASRKSDDNHTVPLCPKHHKELHENGNETKYLNSHGYKNPLDLSELLYKYTNDQYKCIEIINNYKSGIQNE